MNHIEPKTMGANRVGPHLWMGSAPPKGLAVKQGGFDVLVLCAMEYQPLAHEFPGVRRVIHCPLDDDPVIGLTEREQTSARAAASQAAEAIEHDQRVLVTCFLGRNRSGVVAALTLMQLRPDMTAEEAIFHVRAARSSYALGNPKFVQLLKAERMRTGKAGREASRLLWTP